jgi:hypothetical protein
MSASFACSFGPFGLSGLFCLCSTNGWCATGKRIRRLAGSYRLIWFIWVVHSIKKTDRQKGPDKPGLAHPPTLGIASLPFPLRHL